MPQVRAIAQICICVNRGDEDALILTVSEIGLDMNHGKTVLMSALALGAQFRRFPIKLGTKAKPFTAKSPPAAGDKRRHDSATSCPHLQTSHEGLRTEFLGRGTRAIWS